MNLPKVSGNWRYFVDTQFNNRILALESTSFVSFFVKADVVKEVGLPIKEFFIWGDDLEYSQRISSRYDSFFVYDSQVVHAIKSNIPTSIVDETDEQRIGRYKLLYRNKYYIARHSQKRAKILYWLEIKYVLSDILKRSKTQKWKKCSLVLKSCMAGLFFNPKIEKVHPVE
jgi:GT2 family glycosyltransferase